MPQHKLNTQATAQMDKLMSAPLTMEDINQFHNLPLINILRHNDKASKSTQGSKPEQDDAGSNQGRKTGGGANDRPPAFFEDDMNKWKLKFAQAIKDREIMKKQMMKTLDVTCLTRNTNVKSLDSDRGISDKTLFGKVMKRRNSRQSSYAPVNVDFDYAGDSAPYHHLIAQRRDLGHPNKQQLNFELKLRGNKNLTTFNAN